MQHNQTVAWMSLHIGVDLTRCACCKPEILGNLVLPLRVRSSPQSKYLSMYDELIQRQLTDMNLNWIRRANG